MRKQALLCIACESTNYHFNGGKHNNIYETIKCICSHTICVYIYSILLRYITHIIKSAVYMPVCALIDSPCSVNITNFRLFSSFLKEMLISNHFQCAPHDSSWPTTNLLVMLVFGNNSAVNISASSCMHMFPIPLGICLEIVLLDCM